jgi:hypothetical protein
MDATGPPGSALTALYIIALYMNTYIRGPRDWRRCEDADTLPLPRCLDHRGGDAHRQGPR